ncbi:WxL protein host-binding domain-containing protein [Latilactobacillus curvatus]
MKVELQNDKWQFIQYSQTLKDGKVAPNSDFDLDVLLGGKRLVPGTYQLTLMTKNDRYTKTLHKQVLITKAQARYINRLNAAYPRNRNWILVGLVVIFLITAGSVVQRVRKRKRGCHAKDGQ